MSDQAESGMLAAHLAPGVEPRVRRWVAPLGAATAGFTALCCLGVSAAVSLSSALGATFLTRDATLRPLLAATLALTVAGSGLTFWRRRQPWPLAVTVVASLWIYSFVYVIGRGHHAPMADHMSGDPTGHAAHAGFSGGRLGAVWFGLALLIGAQLFDLPGARASWQRRRAAPGEPRR